MLLFRLNLAENSLEVVLFVSQSDFAEVRIASWLPAKPLSHRPTTVCLP